MPVCGSLWIELQILESSHFLLLISSISYTTLMLKYAAIKSRPQGRSLKLTKMTHCMCNFVLHLLMISSVVNGLHSPPQDPTSCCHIWRSQIVSRQPTKPNHSSRSSEELICQPRRDRLRKAIIRAVMSDFCGHLQIARLDSRNSRYARLSFAAKSSYHTGTQADLLELIYWNSNRI